MRYAGSHCRKTWLKIKMENHCGLKFLLEQNGEELAFFSRSCGAWSSGGVAAPG